MKFKKAFFIRSSSLSGAEKRALKINFALNSGGNHYGLLINKKLLNLILQSEYKKFLVNYLVYDEYSFFEKAVLKVLIFKKFHRWFQFLKINKLLKHFEIELLHIFLSIDGGKNLSSKKVFEITSPDYVKRIEKNKKYLLPEIDLFHAVSKSTFMKSLDFIPKEKIVQAPIPFFSPNPDSTDSLSDIQSKKENTIIFAHRFIARKNGRLFAETAKKFLNRNSGWNIKMFGDGPEENEIKVILQDEIQVGKASIGFTSNLTSELAKSKIFVSLISPDNYPSQSILESMNMENALLLSDTGFSQEMFISGNGLVCKTDREDVLEKLEELCAMDLVKMGEESRKILQARFDKELYLEHLINLHQEVLDN